MRCLHCGLTNPPDALRCDCGFDFRTGYVVAEPASPEEAPPPSEPSTALSRPRLIVLSSIGSVIAILLLAIAWLLFQSALDRRNARQREKSQTAKLAALSETKQLGRQSLSGSASTSLQTKWIDGLVFFQLSISGVPAPGLQRGRNAAFYISLEDKDGFDRMSVEIEAPDMIESSLGATKWYNWSGSRFMAAETYAEIEGWSLTWRGITIPETAKAPTPGMKPAPSLPWQNKANWRKLRKDMSMAQVRSILGEPHSVSRSGSSVYWKYDPTNSYRSSVDFLFDELYSWVEP